MAVVLSGWFDDSERDDEEHAVASLGGCVGTAAQWEIQDAAWIEDVLEPFGLTEGYHAKDFPGFKGQYAQFRDNPKRIRGLSDAIDSTFKKSQVRPFAASTRLADLRRFNRERGRCVSFYALNIYTCMFMIRQAFRKELAGDAVAQMNLDVSNSDVGTHRAGKLAMQYASTHPEAFGPFDNVLAAPMPNKGMARITPALQAADFAAWEARKSVEEKDGFWNERPDGESNQDLRTSLTKWNEQAGRKSPFKRGSMQAFMTGKPYAVPFTWHFNGLCAFDDLRQGVWVPEKSKK